MAVAPGSAVKELYGLLFDMEGDLLAARRHAVIRASRVPSVHLPPSEPARMCSAASQTQCVDLLGSDNEKQNIDLNDPRYICDPDTLSPAIRPKKTLTTKTRLPKGAATNSCQPKSNTSRKRTKAAALRRRRDRENSIVRDFLAPDDQKEYDTDKSPSVTSERHDACHEENDLDMESEDPENLRIDMRPQYAYKAAILDRRRKKRR